tara:strand:+ start:193 stop:534 length:342 start_codon:yes stop_codon:yes gene_type:complete
MKELSQEDYKTIIHHYGFPLPKSKKLIQKKGEDLISRKLCSCIKKVTKKFKNNETPAIGICTYSVLKNRNLKIKSFTCKRKRKVLGLRKTKKIRFRRKKSRKRRKKKSLKRKK